MDKMREEFVAWLRSNHLTELPGMYTAWQHLYPMVEAAYREGHFDGWVQGDSDERDEGRDWNNSTAKARLEGKDD